MEARNSHAWSTTALLNYQNTNDDVDHHQTFQPPETSMQPSPSLSQLMKRRRRRCGGVFKPAEGSSNGFAVEYEWPYRQSAQASVPTLSIDTSTANEAFFRRSNVELEQRGSSSGSSSLGLGMRVEGRKYSFERDIESIGFMRTAVRNLATTDGFSTRSPSVYSQESERIHFEDLKEVDDHQKQAIEDTSKPVKPAQWLERSSSLAMPKVRSRIRDGFNSGKTNTGVTSPEVQSVNTGVKLTRSASTTFQSIRRVSSKLGARTRSLTNIFTEKVSEHKARPARGMKTRETGGQVSGGSPESKEVGSGMHSLSENAVHGPRRSTAGLRLHNGKAKGDQAIHQFFGSGNRKGGGQRRAY